jgi:hypothetical protein
VLIVPIAAFLAGALLSILLPLVLVVALLAWYDVLVRRRGEPADTSDLGGSGAEASGTGSAPSAPGSGAGSPSQPQGGP